jgi:hypothetical protein
MSPSPIATSTPQLASAQDLHQPSQHAERAYQGLTIAVMLLLLGSLLLVW